MPDTKGNRVREHPSVKEVAEGSQGDSLLDLSLRSLLAALKAVTEQVAQLDRLAIG